MTQSSSKLSNGGPQSAGHSSPSKSTLKLIGLLAFSLPLCILMAEATVQRQSSYVTGLEAAKMVQKLQIRQHGDLESAVFWRGLPPDTKRTLLSLFHEDIHLSYSVVICHSEPGAWYPPLFQTCSPCPPTGYEEPLFTIGRTMFETDRVNPDHVKRCNRMDEIWVPTQFHVEAFTHSGCRGNKAGQGGDNVVLYVLTNRYHMTNKEFSSLIDGFVDSLEIPEPEGGWPAVYLVPRHIPQVDLPGLYKLADCFVLPSHGEGVGSTNCGSNGYGAAGDCD
ncbi:unnamed protein product [Sphagnum tenellum]